MWCGVGDERRVDMHFVVATLVGQMRRGGFSGGGGKDSFWLEVISTNGYYNYRRQAAIVVVF